MNCLHNPCTASCVERVSLAETVAQLGNSLKQQTERVSLLEEALKAPLAMVQAQAEDEGLWSFPIGRAETIAEAHLQRELRRLHYAIESNAKYVSRQDSDTDSRIKPELSATAYKDSIQETQPGAEVNVDTASPADVTTRVNGGGKSQPGVSPAQTDCHKAGHARASFPQGN